MVSRKKNMRSTSILRYKAKQYILRKAGGVSDELATALVEAQASNYLLGSASYMSVRRMVEEVLMRYGISTGFYTPYMAVAQWITKNIIKQRRFSDKFAIEYIKEAWPELVDIAGGEPLKDILKNLGFSEDVINEGFAEIETAATAKATAASEVARATEEEVTTPTPSKAGTP